MERKKKMDRRSVMSRRLFGEALLELIKHKTFDEITIKEIAETADLNRGTFYLHYATKEELLFDLLSERFEKLVAQVEALAQNSSGVFVWESPTPDVLVYEHVYENADLYRYVLAENGMGVIINQIIDYIASVIAEETIKSNERVGLGEPWIPVEIIARHVAGSMYALLVWWIENEFPYSPAEMAKMGHQLTLSGCVSLLPASEWGV